MGLPAAAQQLLLLAETGDTPDSRVRGVIAALFTAQGVTDSATDVQLLTVKQQSYEIQRAFWRAMLSRVLNSDERETWKLRLDEIERALAATVAERQVILNQSAASGGVAAGQLTTVAPWSPPIAGGRDANDSRYGGDPYRRGGWR